MLSGMQIPLVCLTSLLTVVVAHPSDIYANWSPPGPNDARGPCPMLNTLANHGFLPRNGLNFTRDDIVNAVAEGLNFDAVTGNSFFDLGVTSNPVPNSTFFDLNTLSRHNVLEKDASLSRVDHYFGDQRRFNETIWNETKSWWKGPIVDRYMFADSRIARQLSSRRDNPTYRFTNTNSVVSTGEIASMFMVFGDYQNMTLDRRLIEYFFENERLPTALGWYKHAPPAAGTTINDMMEPLFEKLEAAYTLLTEPLAPMNEKMKRATGLGHFL